MMADGSRSPRTISLIFIASVVASASLPSQAEAFDYLEHSYFTDYACHHTQRLLATRISSQPQDEDLLAKYIALSLYCPRQWQTTYCQDDEKLLLGSIHELSASPIEQSAVSLTLGDYAALPDHFARFGPVAGLPMAGDDGLLEWTVRWLARQRKGGVGGVVEDVAEDACETRNLSPWPTIERDLDRALERAIAHNLPPESVPSPLLTPLARDPIPRGPRDPAGAYSFDNPHYLDLILRNHNHFGVQAYSSWLGFHSSATQIAARRCQETMALTARRLRNISKQIKGFEHISWPTLSPEERAEQGCLVLGQLILQRLDAWRTHADPALVSPVADLLASLLNSPPDLSAADARILARLLDKITAATMSLVFEGSGLHFLQDGLASGHMRTIRTRGGLQEARYDHDLDNQHGVVALLSTRAGRAPFVAFGDSYLLGPAPAGSAVCDGFDGLNSTARADVSACLLQHQRGVIMMVTLSSLLDWALGGTLYGVETARSGERCALDGALEQVICRYLPDRATLVAGEEAPAIEVGSVMHHGSLPLPPPPFSYEALTTRIGFDVAGRAPQVNLSFTLLSELDSLANWLTSYRIGLNASLGDGESQQWFTDLTYSFHWRWAARFMIDMGASAYAGFRDDNTLDLEQSRFFTGISPVVGITALPEGWIKIPIELSISYRLPINVYTAREGFFQRPILDGHWIYIGFGLAFMR